MLWAEVDWNACCMCEPCQARLACNTRAIVKFPGDEPAFIDLDRCHGCGKCLPACLCEAIQLNNSRRSNGRDAY